jgi:hypothetical protein
MYLYTSSQNWDVSKKVVFYGYELSNFFTYRAETQEGQMVVQVEAIIFLEMSPIHH